MNDTTAASDRRPWEQLVVLAEAGDAPALDIYLSSLSSTDQAYAIAHLDEDEIVAVSIGGTVPLIVKRLGFDPAIASGPLLTTITDMCGFFLVLGIASQMLDKLVVG